MSDPSREKDLEVALEVERLARQQAERDFAKCKERYDRRVAAHSVSEQARAQAEQATARLQSAYAASAVSRDHWKARADELLAALKALVSHAEDDTDDRRLSDEVAAAKVAIAKAEGQP